MHVCIAATCRSSVAVALATGIGISPIVNIIYYLVLTSALFDVAN